MRNAFCAAVDASVRCQVPTRVFRCAQGAAGAAGSTAGAVLARRQRRAAADCRADMAWSIGGRPTRSLPAFSAERMFSSDGTGGAPVDGEAPRGRVPEAGDAWPPRAAAPVLARAAARPGSGRATRAARAALGRDGARVVQAAPAPPVRAGVSGTASRLAVPALPARRRTGEGGGDRADFPRGPEGRLSCVPCRLARARADHADGPGLGRLAEEAVL